MTETTLPRRRFLAALAGLFAAGAAAPSILARLRRPSWADTGPIVIRDNVLTAPAQWVTLNTNRGTYRAPVVDGVANFANVLPGGPLYIYAVDANGEPVVRTPIKL